MAKKISDFLKIGKKMEFSQTIGQILFSLAIFLIAEYIADFLEQDRETALNKSSNFRYLFKHGVDIWSTIGIAGLIFGIQEIIYMSAIYAAIHMIQDKFIWSYYKYSIKNKGSNFEYWNDKTFYDVIGLDRLLHVLTIVGMYAIYYKVYICK